MTNTNPNQGQNPNPAHPAARLHADSVTLRYDERTISQDLSVSIPDASPDGITVADLVARSRYPHQSFLRQWSTADEDAVIVAMEATRVTDLSGRMVDELSD